MKNTQTFLIIGMGNFGHYLCRELLKYKCEVMIVDCNEDALSDMLPYVTSAKVGDCTSMDVLSALGVRNFDVCFICVGDNFQNSLEITSLVKELGAKYVVSRAVREIQAKFLLRNGADRVIYPERDIAERIAKAYSNTLIYDYIELDDNFSIYEIETFNECIGKSIQDFNFSAKYNASIIAIKSGSKPMFVPPIDYVFNKDDHLIVAGNAKNLDKFL